MVIHFRGLGDVPAVTQSSGNVFRDIGLDAEQEALAMKEGRKREKAAKKVTRVAQQIQDGPVSSIGTKTRVTTYLSDEVIAFFKAMGPGWQTRMNDVLVRVVREGADRWLDK